MKSRRAPYLIFILFLTMFLTACSSNKVRSQDNGELYYDKQNNTMYDTKTEKAFTGTSVLKDSRGVYYESDFKDGKEHGKIKTTYPNGYYAETPVYKGELNGKTRYYNSNGQEISKEDFQKHTEH